MRTTDDLNPERQGPLGAPIRPDPAPTDEWVPADPATPHIQRHTRTGAMRNIRPTPPPEVPQYPWFGLPKP